ncbi:MAG TPA: ribosome recycling factor [Alphaproteobacteria bacterium]|jgi:ribosome recycling factor|nr:ribosome recycling factor [Alphaproteobacteria bacterium]
MPDPGMNEFKKRMDGALGVFKQELQGLRTGRASASLLEPVQVPAYGGEMPLNQVASISVPEPRLIVVNVWDRALASAVDKAIRDANLGVNPQTEGQTIRVPIPALTQERRTELVKLAHKYAEQARVSIRNVRRDGMDKLKKMEKDREISEDEHRSWSEKIQAMTDGHIKDVDGTLASKEKDIMTV